MLHFPHLSSVAGTIGHIQQVPRDSSLPPPYDIKQMTGLGTQMVEKDNREIRAVGSKQFTVLLRKVHEHT
jgi:hypothetical protein